MQIKILQHRPINKPINNRNTFLKTLSLYNQLNNKLRFFSTHINPPSENEKTINFIFAYTKENESIPVKGRLGESLL